MNLDRQARIMTTYLIGTTPSKKVLKLYSDAIKKSSITPDAVDQKLLNHIDKHPRSLGRIDAALPFYKPYSEVRRRLYVLLAILEATPDYHEKFLPVARNPFYVVAVGLACVRAVFKAVVGSFVVRVVAR